MKKKTINKSKKMLTREEMEEMIEETEKSLEYKYSDTAQAYDEGLIDGMRNLMQKILDN